MNKIRTLHVKEPELEFRFGQKLTYPRDGLYLFGPVDAVQTPRAVKYGFIGTPNSLRRFREWVASVSSLIDVPIPGPRSKANEPHHVAFPGVSEAFFANWPLNPHSAITDIDEGELLKRLRISNRHEAIKAAVDVFVEKLVAEQNRNEDPPSFWFVVIPEFVFQMGRPQSTVSRRLEALHRRVLQERRTSLAACWCATWCLLRRTCLQTNESNQRCSARLLCSADVPV